MNSGSDNGSGMADLDRMLATIRALPRALTVDLAPAIADAMRADLQRTIAAGTAPDGTPWALRKHDGARALQDAAASVHVAALGAYIYVRVTGVEARHHQGTIKGKVKRQVIYQGTSMPPGIVQRVEAITARKFQDHMRGGGT